MIASTPAPKIQKFIRGDSRVLKIVVTNSDGTPFNLTGCTIFFTLNINEEPANDTTDTTAIIKKTATSIPSPALGIANITLTNTDTKALSEDEYWYDIQLKDNSGNITSLARNQFTVIDDITTRIV